MQLIKVDPRALVESPDHSRQTKSSPQADALLLASIKAVGIVQPPVVSQQADGGNGFLINAGRRRVRLAIAAGLEEIDVLVDDPANDNGAMRSMVENIAREALNPVDQWRAIERLVALGWTEEAIGVALALPVRQIRKLRLLANVLLAMLDHMAKGDMPDERQLRTIAAASLDEQKEVWKKHKPSKADPQVSWWSVAQALQKTRMYARHASFGDDLAQAYGIAWVEDLFAPADEDSRYTTDVEAFLGAQQEWMTANLPKKGVIAETTNYGEVKLPPKAERVYGKPTKSDCTAMYLDRDGRVQTVHYRLPAAKKPKGKGATGPDNAADDVGEVSKPRPDVTRKGVEMIGDLRTDALREALGRAPIEDDTLMALLILAFAGQNVSVTTGSGGTTYGHSRLAKNAVVLFDANGKLAFDMDTLRVAARTMLVDVFSCRENATNSGIVARVAGEVVGADAFLPNMGTEDFLACLSRPALEASCKDTPVLPRQRVKDTRAALVEHFKEGHFVHPSALFAPDPAKLSDFLSSGVTAADDDETEEDADSTGDDASDEATEAFQEAAE
ncbi:MULTISPECIES: ParB N-terminal domain-containing protein [Rhodopseudomonas]|jgi:ParB family chromosome partitioning protein|uniref:Plasmid partitioning protein n=1 Tax=Rhodopseudomonas palustris TaxID=1076 RepID=A0A0D7E7B8_RHOPL|nr:MULTISPECIES: ParB N-terminal domain-containing protein [Rhodopseudomonas]KIZ36380.1 plasmid partitioning protein [Rhodopseudomonas palustris]MDF3809696.1 ParB N-terminal domain-containing protein [Rhodopseudomonas sp. BAL398]WOK21039.1 ParB N-terminal domain-containing protein [Rhodopseudomonas sp. BAL398]